MKRLIKTLDSNNKLKQFLLILTVFFVFVGLNCVNSLDQGSSDDPAHTGIIFVNPIPFAIFGNSIDQSLIEVLTEVFPNGSIIEFEITGSDLPPNLRGCVFGDDVVIVNGEAVANYLAGILIASAAELSSSEPPVATLNIAANITTPDGDMESDFGPLFLLAVGIIPPEDQTIAPNSAGDPLSIPIVFQTIGIPPGPTGPTVTFSLSDPTLGSLNPTMAQVMGTEESGTATTQYTAFNNTLGTQTITATIPLPNPAVLDPGCPNVSVQIQASTVVMQVAPMPTPTPSPTPVPTPTPIPAIDLICPDQVVSGDQDTCECLTNLGPGSQLCFFVISPAMPSLMIVPPPCFSTDAGGDVQKIILAGAVVSAQVNLVRCCISPNNMVCDPGEPDDVEAVTVVPSTPILPDLICPVQIVSGTQNTCKCSTNQAGVQVCFDVISPAMPTLDILPVEPNCVLTDSGGDATTIIQADMGVISPMVNLVQCCISPSNTSCVGDPDDVESVIVVPVPTPTPTPAPSPSPAPTPTLPPTGIIITAGDLTPVAGGSTVIEAFSGQNVLDLCVQFLVNSSPASDLDPGNNLLSVCATPNGMGNVLSTFSLDVAAGTSGDEIRIIGCIDNATNGMCDGADPLSNTLIFNVQ